MAGRFVIFTLSHNGCAIAFARDHITDVTQGSQAEKPCTWITNTSGQEPVAVAEQFQDVLARIGEG